MIINLRQWWNYGEVTKNTKVVSNKDAIKQWVNSLNAEIEEDTNDYLVIAFDERLKDEVEDDLERLRFEYEFV